MGRGGTVEASSSSRSPRRRHRERASPCSGSVCLDLSESQTRAIAELRFPQFLERDSGSRCCFLIASEGLSLSPAAEAPECPSPLVIAVSSVLGGVPGLRFGIVTGTGSSLLERDSRVTVPCWSAALADRDASVLEQWRQRCALGHSTCLRRAGVLAQRREPAWSLRGRGRRRRRARCLQRGRLERRLLRPGHRLRRLLRVRGVARRPAGRAGGVRRLPGAAVPGRVDEPVVDVRLRRRHRVVQQPAPPAEPGRRAGGGPDRGAGQLLRLRLPDARSRVRRTRSPSRRRSRTRRGRPTTSWR